MLDEGGLFINKAALSHHFNVKELEFYVEETKKRKLHKLTGWIIEVIDEKTRN